MTDVEAVVAGAGPAGTVAASLLAQKGVSVLLCEAGPTCAEDLRASTFHPPTVEMLDELDVAEPLIAIGLKAPVYTYRDRRTGETVSFDMAEIGDRTRYPFRLQCEQFHLSRMLAERLARHAKASVEFSHRVIGFQQDDDGVTVHIETPFAITHVRARFLVGADGGNSIVRKWLETEFEGFTLPEKFLCLSTEMPLERHLDNLSLVNYVSDPKEWLVLLRVPSVWRILVPAPENQTDEYLLSDDRADLLFRDLLGTDCKVKTRHRTIYR
ncbi:MAG TPA: FAD-dependent monooxygenase, partial [Candidatus Krumholzibacteria bacterium]